MLPPLLLVMHTVGMLLGCSHCTSLTPIAGLLLPAQGGSGVSQVSRHEPGAQGQVWLSQGVVDYVVWILAHGDAPRGIIQLLSSTALPCAVLTAVTATPQVAWSIAGVGLVVPPELAAAGDHRFSPRLQQDACSTMVRLGPVRCVPSLQERAILDDKELLLEVLRHAGTPLVPTQVPFQNVTFCCAGL